MNRRSFLASLAAAFVADPERLLFVPGKKLISIPKPSPIILYQGDKLSVLLRPNLGKSYRMFLEVKQQIEAGVNVGVCSGPGLELISGRAWIDGNAHRFPMVSA